MNIPMVYGNDQVFSLDTDVQTGTLTEKDAAKILIWVALVNLLAWVLSIAFVFIVIRFIIRLWKGTTR